MRSPSSFRSACGFAVAAALLAACPAGASTLPSAGANWVQSMHRPSASSRSWMSHIAPTTPLVYISDELNQAVIIFNAKTGQVVGQLAQIGFDFPQGIFVDEAHNLYVTSQLSHNVLVFPRGATSPSETLDDSNGYPMDVTVCRNGTVYVANNTTMATGTGNIEIYAGGSTSPTGQLVFPGIAYEYFLTCDPKGNIFTTITNGSFNNDVVEFKKAKQTGAVDLNILLGNAGAVRADAAGNILVDDQGSNTITEYTEAGQATGQSITLTGHVFDFAVSKNGAFLGGPDLFKGTGYVWSWPGGVMQSVQYVDPDTNTGVMGFAYDPPRRGFGK